MPRMMPAGASRLLDPIHGRGVFQRSNISSNLKGCMRRMLAAGGAMHGNHADFLNLHQ